MSMLKTTWLLELGAVLAVSAAMLQGCGGGASAASIGGTVSGLVPGASVTLQDSTGETLSLPTNESFSFATLVAAGDSYSVSVVAQPVGESCNVANGSGVVDSSGDDVTGIDVTCSLTSSIGGSVSGLGVGESVWLSANGQVLPVAANGAFAFPGVLAPGTAFDVTIAAQPAQQACVVTGGSGVASAGVLANVTVTCG